MQQNHTILEICCCCRRHSWLFVAVSLQSEERVKTTGLALYSKGRDIGAGKHPLNMTRSYTQPEGATSETAAHVLNIMRVFCANPCHIFCTLALNFSHINSKCCVHRLECTHNRVGSTKVVQYVSPSLLCSTTQLRTAGRSNAATAAQTYLEHMCSKCYRNGAG